MATRTSGWAADIASELKIRSDLHALLSLLSFGKPWVSLILQLEICYKQAIAVHVYPGPRSPRDTQRSALVTASWRRLAKVLQKADAAAALFLWPMMHPSVCRCRHSAQSLWTVRMFGSVHTAEDLRALVDNRALVMREAASDVPRRAMPQPGFRWREQLPYLLPFRYLWWCLQLGLRVSSFSRLRRGLTGDMTCLINICRARLVLSVVCCMTRESLK